MTVNQISIFLENKYGKLSEILALLAEENIRIIAATVADTSEYGDSTYYCKRSAESIQDIEKQQCKCESDGRTGYRDQLLCRKFCTGIDTFYKKPV